MSTYMSDDVTDNAYILHSRAYTDSRIIIEFFTENHGRVAGIFRLPSKKRHFKPQPFTLYTIHWRWGAELKTILFLDPIANAEALVGKASYCGLYLNELVLRLLSKEDPSPEIFAAYGAALKGLVGGQELEAPLRHFELGILAELGYAVDFDFDSSGSPIAASSSVAYLFKVGEGFSLYSVGQKQVGHIYSGAVLRDISARNFSNTPVKNAAKQICRACLAPLLGAKPLKSRELFL